ncbi:hypothetical protein F5Y09DRAFT_323423 [Xylaria sp. FL1042]|nr:hypothetical protein F5Y09DRAFT_323423 [Xylaria sp. FL1042]
MHSGHQAWLVSLSCLDCLNNLALRHHIIWPYLRSSYCTPKECPEIIASFPLLFSPTRHLPEAFVMDQSLLCSVAQEMALCLSWSTMVMSSFALVIRRWLSRLTSFLLTLVIASVALAISHSFKASRQSHSFSNSNYAPLATLAHLLQSQQ